MNLHISGNEKQKFFVDTYQTNFELCLPHANKSSSFHGICSSFWLGLDLQCVGAIGVDVKWYSTIRAWILKFTVNKKAHETRNTN